MKKKDLISFISHIVDGSDYKGIAKKAINFLNPNNFTGITLTKDDFDLLINAITEKEKHSEYKSIGIPPLSPEIETVINDFKFIFNSEMNDEERKKVTSGFEDIYEALNVYSKKHSSCNLSSERSYFYTLYFHVLQLKQDYEKDHMKYAIPSFISENVKDFLETKERAVKAYKNFEKARQENKDLEQQLRRYAAAGNFVMVKQLLKFIHDPNAKGDNKGNAALHEIIINLANGNIEKANADAKGSDKKTSLERALICIELLVNDSRADVNIRDRQDNTPYILAARLLSGKDRDDVLSKLRDLKADIHLVNKQQFNAMHYLPSTPENSTRNYFDM